MYVKSSTITTRYGLEFDIRTRYVIGNKQFKILILHESLLGKYQPYQRRCSPSQFIFKQKVLCLSFLNLLINVPLENISRIWRRQHWRWRARHLRSLIGRKLYSVIPAAVPHRLRFLLSHLMDLLIQSVHWGAILTRIFSGQTFWENKQRVWLWKEKIWFIYFIWNSYEPI